MLSIKTFGFILVMFSSLMAGCESPADTTKLNVDRTIPPSEAFDASYGFYGPDGKFIYFAHSEKLGSDPAPGKLDQLWKLNLATGRRSKIHDGRILNADISPKGKWFVFNSFFPPQYLYKMRSDGSDLQKLRGSNSPNSDWEYTIMGKWSPNGSQILFSLSAGIPRGVSLIDSSGKEPRVIIPYGIEPSWSSDGTKILYLNFDTTKIRKNSEQIFIANSSGSQPLQLSKLHNTYFNIHYPIFSPSGDKIVFVYDGEVFIMKTDSKNPEQVTDGSGYTVRPEWRPDGQTILFSRIIPNVSKRLYYLNVATREVTPVFPKP